MTVSDAHRAAKPQRSPPTEISPAQPAEGQEFISRGTEPKARHGTKARHETNLYATKNLRPRGGAWYDAAVATAPSVPTPSFTDSSSSPGSSECTTPPPSSQVWPCLWLSVPESGSRSATRLNSIPRRKQRDASTGPN